MTMRLKNQRKGSAVAGEDQIINDTDNKFLVKCLKDHHPTLEEVNTLFRKASAKFVWYDPF